jgi:RNA polymerase sigma factor (sigma-70 family)
VASPTVVALALTRVGRTGWAGRAGGAAGQTGPEPLEGLLGLAARGDEQASTELYQRAAASVFGLVSRVVRDPAQSEEVTQEVFVEVWRTASRFDPERGATMSWIMTTAHRRAVDRVRSAQRAAERNDLVGRRDQQRPYDEVVEQVETSLEREHVRRGLETLTELQREAVILGLLRRLHPPGDLRAARGTVRDREDAPARRADPAPGSPGGGHMTADLHTLTGAYAAHALSEREELAFEHHLEACQACAQEVRELQATAARLGAAVATQPPAALWDQVRAEVQVTRQLPPVIGRGDRRPLPRRGLAAAGRLRAGRRRFHPLVAAAAALLVVATSLAVLNLDLGRRLDQSELTGDQVAAVLAAPDARTVTARPGSAGNSTVVVSRARGQAVFVTSGLPATAEDRTYQLWAIGPGGPRSAGLLEAGSGGRATTLLEGRVGDAEQVALTVERRGGSPQPTSKPVVVVDLQRA